MGQKEKDRGVLLVILKRFNKQRLPRALALKKKVDAGELLNEYDYKLIKKVLKDEKNPIIRILEIATEDNWNTLEQKWIINFDNLTNQTKKGKLHTEEHKANLKKAWVKRKSREANE